MADRFEVWVEPRYAFTDVSVEVGVSAYRAPVTFPHVTGASAVHAFSVVAHASVTFPHVQGASVVHAFSVQASAAQTTFPHVQGASTVHPFTIASGGSTVTFPHVAGASVVHAFSVQESAAQVTFPHVQGASVVHPFTIQAAGGPPASVTFPHVIGESVARQFIIDPNDFAQSINPLGNPIGGGKGYSTVYDPAGVYDYVVNNRAEFLSHTGTYTDGQSVFIPEGSSVILQLADKGLSLPGLRILSDRGRDKGGGLYSRGGIFGYDFQGTALLDLAVHLDGNDGELSGLRLRGNFAARGTHDYAGPVGYGGLFRFNGTGWNIHNNEGYAANIWLLYLNMVAGNVPMFNFFHHTQRDGHGYLQWFGGSDNLDLWARSLGNRLDYGRHHLAHSGHPFNLAARHNIYGLHYQKHQVDNHAPNTKSYFVQNSLFLSPSAQYAGMDAGDLSPANEHRWERNWHAGPAVLGAGQSLDIERADAIVRLNQQNGAGFDLPTAQHVVTPNGGRAPYTIDLDFTNSVIPAGRTLKENWIWEHQPGKDYDGLAIEGGQTIGRRFDGDTVQLTYDSAGFYRPRHETIDNLGIYGYEHIDVPVYPAVQGNYYVAVAFNQTYEGSLAGKYEVRLWVENVTQASGIQLLWQGDIATLNAGDHNHLMLDLEAVVAISPGDSIRVYEGAFAVGANLLGGDGAPISETPIREWRVVFYLNHSFGLSQFQNKNGEAADSRDNWSQELLGTGGWSTSQGSSEAWGQIKGITIKDALDNEHNIGDGYRYHQTLIAAPVSPAQPTTIPGDTFVDLSWLAAAGADTYEVWRSLVSGHFGELIHTTAPGATSYTDDDGGAGLTNGVAYYYTIFAVDAAGRRSMCSPEETATPSAASQPLVIAGQAVWEPTVASPGFDAAGNVNLPNNVGPVSVIENDYLSRVNRWDFNGSSHLWVPRAGLGHPFETVTGGFCVAVMLNIRATSPDYGAIIANGGDNGTTQGWAIRYRIQGAQYQPYMWLTDGAGVRTLHGFGNHLFSPGEDRMHIFNFDPANNRLRLYDGNRFHIKNREKSLATLTLPFTPARDLSLGSRIAGSQSSNFDGKATVMVFPRALTEDEIHRIWNYDRYHLWSEIQAYNGPDHVSQVHLGISDTDRVRVSAYCSEPTRARVFDTAGTFVAESALLAPNAGGWVKAEVPGLAAGTDYHVRFTNAAAKESQYEARARTLASGAHSFGFFFGGCYNLAQNDDTGIAIFMRDYAAASPIPIYGMINLGDRGYYDHGANDITLYRGDPFAYAGVHGHKMLSQLLAELYMRSDHDGWLNDYNLETGPAGFLDAMQDQYREWFPHPPLELGTGALYHAVTVGRMTIVIPDLRSEREPTAGRIYSAAQKAWIEGLMDDCALNGRVMLFASEHEWQGAGSEEWGAAGFVADRTAIGNKIASTLPNSFFSIFNDQHGVLADSGPNHAFGTGGTGPFRAYCASPMNHGARQNSTTYDLYAQVESGGAFGLFEVTDTGGATVSITVTFYGGSGATVLFTHTDTLNIP